MTDPVPSKELPKALTAALYDDDLWVRASDVQPFLKDRTELQIRVDNLNADLAYIRRRTGFWGEGPQEDPSKDMVPEVRIRWMLSTFSDRCFPQAYRSELLSCLTELLERRASPPPCPAPADTLTELADWLTAHSHTLWATQFGHGPHMRRWAEFIREIKR